MPLTEFDYNENNGQVKKVVFAILSPERIKEKSVCEIYKNITSTNNQEGTLKDPRLGPIERGLICPTCQSSFMDCVGHFGHIVLAKPVYHVQYYPTIIKLLRCFCNRCSSILVNKFNPDIRAELTSKTGRNRMAYAESSIGKTPTCPNCGAAQPKYDKEKEGILRIKAYYPVKDKNIKTGIPMNPEIVHTIFKNISDEDVNLIGLDHKLSRPEWMIWTIMPVPPPAMRPSVKTPNGISSDDDLTHKLNDCIKYNHQLRLKIAESSDVTRNFIDDYWQLLQYHVATYIDNEISNLPKAQQRSGRPLKTLRQRVKTKEGRVRGNLMGKRVDGSARSVITADPSLSMDQLGVPRRVAMNLTYPELVTQFNIAKMTQLVRNGPAVYPGAKHIKRKGENMKSLKNFKNREDLQLRPGDIVYRHILDNDWVLFNRQPSLHKMSMMGLRAKILDDNTFRMNVNICAPFAADFDGADF